MLETQDETPLKTGIKQLDDDPDGEKPQENEDKLAENGERPHENGGQQEGGEELEKGEEQLQSVELLHNGPNTDREGIPRIYIVGSITDLDRPIRVSI